MKTLATTYPLAELAWALDVSRSGYYRWLKAPASKRAQAARQLTEHIRRIHFESRSSYGSPLQARFSASHHRQQAPASHCS